MLNTPPRLSLPQQIDPRKFAQQGIEISGSVALVSLPRLSEVLASPEGDIQVNLIFGIGEQRILNVTGDISASVNQRCQRCLEPVLVSLSCQLSLAILWAEEDGLNLPKSYDPWVVGEGMTDIYTIVEDELLLSLPIVSYHEGDCIPKELFSSGEEHSRQDEQISNPFQVLEQLKGTLPRQTPEDEP